MKNIVLCDLDGTLANIEHRLYHIQSENKNWDAFFEACDEDGIILPVVTTIQALITVGAHVWIITGRSDSVRQKTVEWLLKNNICYANLIMRRAGDHTVDTNLKRSWLKDGTIPVERVFVAFEDRSSVVKMYRSEGVQCLQVSEGEF